MPKETPAPPFRVAIADWTRDRDPVQAVRRRVFIEEQGVPEALEHDVDDARHLHVLARDADGAPIGTARLTRDRRIGRMAVLPAWRGRGVADALMEVLLHEARARRLPDLLLHAQIDAAGLYARHGFLPEGERFEEAGIVHQAMRRVLDGVQAIDTQAAGVAIATAVARHARRGLWLYSRDLDPGLFDAPDVLAALRRLATRRGDVAIRILVQDPEAAQRAHAPLLALAQRLPSVFAFRSPEDPVDRSCPSAFLVNDAGGYYFRPLGHRFDGEAELDGGGRSRQLLEQIRPVWERARPCTELRALGL